MNNSPTPPRTGFREKARKLSGTCCDWDCRAAGARQPSEGCFSRGGSRIRPVLHSHRQLLEKSRGSHYVGGSQLCDSQRVPWGGLQVDDGGPAPYRDVCDGRITDDVDRDLRDGEPELIGDHLEKIVCQGSGKRDVVDLVVNDIARAFGDRKLHHPPVRAQQNDDRRSVFLIQYFLYGQLLRERLPAAVSDPVLAAVAAGEQGNRQERRKQEESAWNGLHPRRLPCPVPGKTFLMEEMTAPAGIGRMRPVKKRCDRIISISYS